MKIHTRWFGPTFLAATLMAVLVACPAPTSNPAPTGDTTKPTVSLASSSTNITTAGSITLTATASDNVGVTKVEFFDGATVQSPTLPKPSMRQATPRPVPR
jgi:ABC-type uncharacterized transport system auxiliary subunit